MRILSWDIGIINLAYCILEEDNWKIHKWDKINIISDDFQKCNFENCNSNATGTKKNNKGDEFFFCTKHKKHFKFEEDNTEITLENFENLDEKQIQLNKDHKIKCCKCKLNAKYCYFYENQDNNLCKTHANMLVKKVNKNKQITKIKNTTSSKYSIDDLKLNLVNKLDKIDFLLDVDGVLIENQPGFKNPRMKAIASTVYDYFLIRGIVDKTKNSKIKFVKYISPSNKLKIDSDKTIKTLGNAGEDKKYKITKSLGIEYTKILINNDKFFYDFLNKEKKKDDLCDAYLQGVYYLNKK